MEISDSTGTTNPHLETFAENTDSQNRLRVMCDQGQKVLQSTHKTRKAPVLKSDSLLVGPLPVTLNTILHSHPDQYRDKQANDLTRPHELTVTPAYDPENHVKRSQTHQPRQRNPQSMEIISAPASNPTRSTTQSRLLSPLTRAKNPPS